MEKQSWFVTGTLEGLEEQRTKPVTLELQDKIANQGISLWLLFIQAIPLIPQSVLT